MQMVFRRQTNSVLGFIAGILAAAFGAKTAKPTTEDLKRTEFSTSTQRLGVRFTERIRNVFRFKWVSSRRRPQQVYAAKKDAKPEPDKKI
jgi:hypothetical protein